MVNYLLEVGTENLPVEFQSSLDIQLRESLEAKLREKRLNFGEIEILYTPRRLTLIVKNLAEKQTDEVKEIKGPPANVAFKEGQPTKAAEGFCKKLNISVDTLRVESFDNVDYVVARVEEIGRDAREVLQEMMPDIILNLKGSHFMRWENLDIRFQRPIRWMLSIIDNDTVPVTIADIKSTNKTHGHRFLAPNEVEINSISSYKDALKELYVLVDPAERKETIRTQIKEIASKAGGKIVENEKLLNTVNNIVEWPVASLGQFEKEYLKLPKELITTVMSAHQKYFAVSNPDESGLLNYFVCVNNKNGGYSENIIKGNQRVLKARLEDAAFYYNEDNKTKLAEKLENLTGVTFQKGLGNMYDKSLRIRAIAQSISDQCGLDDEAKVIAARAGELCKADLTTFMVREFTELEGVMGKVYALNSGETAEVAEAIGEHYLPRSAEDSVPKTRTGMFVAIADKLDTIVSVFSIGKSPTGSADPLGLRRAALGIILIMLKNNLTLNLSQLIQEAYNLLGTIKRDEDTVVLPAVKEFIIQRLRVYLQEQKYRYDAIEAALQASDPLVNLPDLIERVKVINELVHKPDYSPFHESANRILRIIKTYEGDAVVNPDLLKDQSEKDFYQALEVIDEKVLTYTDLVEQLRQFTPVVEKFFDDVLVMDKDEEVKKNRLAMLKKADLKYKKLADFSFVVN
jgi:glycyl-tRNA synthetase beta chain